MRPREEGEGEREREKSEKEERTRPSRGGSTLSHQAYLLAWVLTSLRTGESHRERFSADWPTLADPNADRRRA